MKLKILLIGILVISVAACRNEHPQKSPVTPELSPVKVQTVTVAAQEATLQTEVVGTIQPVDRAEIAAKVTGTIGKIPVTLGSQVKEGDLLVKIIAGEISAKVQQAKAQLEQARRNLERERKLLEKKAATPEKVKSLEEAFRIADAAYSESTVMLSYTTITAPFSGQITRKNVNVGDLARPGLTLLELEDTSNLQVVTSVPEGLVLKISLGDELPIHIPAAQVDLHGRVAEIAPAADPLSRTAAVKIDIEEKVRLLSGQFARVALPCSEKDTILVPGSAVQVDGQMDKLFVVRENKAHLRLVRTGERKNGKIEILAGLEPGETIVTNPGGSKLVDGQPVIPEQ